MVNRPEDDAAQALEVRTRGWQTYKVHLPRDFDFDLAPYRACREAVGPSLKLMADPVAAYATERALGVGRELEKLDYYRLDEPLFDVFHGTPQAHREAGHPDFRDRGPGGQPLLEHRVHRLRRRGHGAHRRFLERRRCRSGEDGPVGRVARCPV